MRYLDGASTFARKSTLNYPKFISSVKAPLGYALLACLAFAFLTLVLVSLVRTELKMPEIGVSAQSQLVLIYVSN